MAPPATDQRPALDWVQPLRVLPSKMETRLGSPYGLGAFGAATVPAEAADAVATAAPIRAAPSTAQSERRAIVPSFPTWKPGGDGPHGPGVAAPNATPPLDAPRRLPTVPRDGSASQRNGE